jgi:hypothetical protein
MLHNKYGCKFSLYCYSDALKMLINNPCYFDDLRMNCHWLMIGFHAERGLGILPSNRTMEQFKTSFRQFLSIIDIGKFPCCKVLRLEFFYASQEEVFFLKKNGIECLLCADDNRISYNLSLEEARILQQNGFLEKDGMCYQKTTCRTERSLSCIYFLQELLFRRPIVLFTHEDLLVGWNKIKFSVAIKLLSLFKYHFFCK